MSETQFFVILIVVVMAVAFLVAALHGDLRDREGLALLPLFEDVIGG